MKCGSELEHSIFSVWMNLVEAALLLQKLLKKILNVGTPVSKGARKMKERFLNVFKLKSYNQVVYFIAFVAHFRIFQ